MDKRNYDEPDDCGLGRCECSEDDRCGCTYPNNVSNMKCPEGEDCDKDSKKQKKTPKNKK